MKNYDTLVRSLVNENFFYFLALITIDRFQSRKKGKHNRDTPGRDVVWQLIF